MTHKEKANQLLRQQYHCSQALFGAFAEDFGLDLKTAFKISTCFGAGMRMGSLCGCISASLMVLGMAFGYYDARDRELEMYGNKKTREFIDRFRERMNGDVLCRDILACDVATPEGARVAKQAGLILKNCPRPIEHSIDILEEMLEESRQEREEKPEPGSAGKDAGKDAGKTYSEFSGRDISSLPEADEIRELIKRNNRTHRFRRNVTELVYTSGKPVAFIQFDIRRFKIINDLYGERFGDEILYFILDQLRELCRDDQYYLNLRSDVFMIVTEYESREGLLDFIRLVEGRISSFRDVQLQFSFGVYTVADKNMELRQMEDRAAMARKSAKDNAMVNILFYREQFKEMLYSRKFIEESIRTAIADHQIRMYLQPKYSITQGSIVGAEALVRWIHPERGMIYPGEFIPVIEENGAIRQVDYYIWEKAAGFIRRCMDIGLTDCPISVNVSRLHLQDDDCKGILEELVSRYGIPKELLELEITETVNDQQISRKSYELRERGFRLLMDDFGSGYSSLEILLETPFDMIKLDKRFIENMMVSDKGKLILESIANMSRGLGLEILAEGVETKEQVEALGDIGCDLVQGYYYAKPMPAEDFFCLLKKSRGISDENAER